LAFDIEVVYDAILDLIKFPLKSKSPHVDNTSLRSLAKSYDMKDQHLYKPELIKISGHKKSHRRITTGDLNLFIYLSKGYVFAQLVKKKMSKLSKYFFSDNVAAIFQPVFLAKLRLLVQKHSKKVYFSLR